MADLVKKEQLQTSLEKVKTYVDSRTPGSEDYVLDVSSLPTYSEFKAARNSGKRIWVKYNNSQYFVTGVQTESSDIQIVTFLVNETMENNPQSYWFHFTCDEFDDSVKMTFEDAKLVASGADVVSVVSTTGGSSWSSITKGSDTGLILSDKNDYVNLLIKTPKSSGSGVDSVSRDLATKDYVDNKATSGVILTETSLWIGSLYISDNVTSVPTTTTTVNGRVYQTMWGQTSGAIATLSDNVENYDALRFYVSYSDETGNVHCAGVHTFDVPIVNNLRFDVTPKLYVVDYLEVYDSTNIGSGQRQVAASFIVGQTASNKIGFGISNVSVKDVGVWQITGIKYNHPVEYTTDERVTGTYLGKTLYEKTLTFNQNFSTGQTTLTHNLGLANVVDYEGWYTRRDGVQVPVDSCRNDAAWYAGASDFTANNFRVNIGTSFTGNSYQLVKLTITFRYTKENAR